MEPSTFLTLDTLKTLAGQLLAIGMVTQMVKATVPAISVYGLRAVAVGIGIALHAALVWHSGMDASAYVLAFVNGTLVAVAAMKAVELVKGNGNGKSASPPPVPALPPEK